MTFGERPLSGDAGVQAPRLLLCRHSDREIRIATVGTRTGKDLDAISAEERLDLRFGAADCRRGGDHFRANRFLLSVWSRDFPAAKRVDGGFVQADHGAQGPGDQVQLVLNDQVRRQERAVL